VKLLTGAAIFLRGADNNLAFAKAEAFFFPHPQAMFIPLPIA